MKLSGAWHSCCCFRTMKVLRFSLALLLGLSLSATLLAAPASQPRAPLFSGSGGALEVDARIGGETARFLLDTGAGMVTISSDLFRRLERRGGVTHLREVGARLADGRIRRMSVYRLPALSVSGCDLGAVEAIVVPGKGRNLLGMNALAQGAPLTLNLAPSPSLVLGGCDRNVVASGASSDFIPAAFAASPLR